MKTAFATLLLAICFSPRISHADEHLHQRQRYVLHSSDVITLDYRYTPEFNQTVTVQPDGYVTLNVVGDVKIAGLTLDEARDQIIKLASNQLNHPPLASSEFLRGPRPAQAGDRQSLEC